MFNINIKKWSRSVHRDLSYFFSGMLLVYAISGFMMNHKDDFNSDYRITRKEISVNTTELSKSLSRENLQKLNKEQAKNTLSLKDGDFKYLKHYYPEKNVLKYFIKGGSTLILDTGTGKGIYENIRKRPIISSLNKLHYNPSKYWTIFSDIFIVSLVLIIISGIIMVPGKKGLKGRGLIELLVGMGVVVLFILL